MKRTILVVEDDRGLNQGIALALGQSEYRFLSAFTIAEARGHWQENKVHMILLDVNLPDGSGYDFLAEVRKRSRLPIIMITANDLEIDEVRGIELGADDYITKPFSLMVLRARVQRLFARTEDAASDIYEDGVFHFDFKNQEFAAAGQWVELSKTEQKLLSLLTGHPGQTMTRELLGERIWQEGADYMDENALSVTVGRLRKKLSAKGQESPIRTVYGIGYTWEK